LTKKGDTLPCSPAIARHLETIEVFHFLWHAPPGTPVVASSSTFLPLAYYIAKLISWHFCGEASVLTEGKRIGLEGAQTT